MTSIPVQLRRRGRLLAFLGAAGMAVWGVAGAGAADAGSAPAPPSYSYSSAVSAIGVQVALQRQPDFSSLPDPFDVETPDSEALLNSYGTSVADGHILNLNGFGGIPGLICLAAGAPKGGGPPYCAQIPVGQVTGGLVPYFPPPDPVDAHATFPHTQSAKAPVLGSQVAQAAIDSGGFALDAGAADATAQQYAATTSVRAQNLVIPGGLTIGSSTTSTSQTATADSLTTVAVSHLSNVALGGTALTIGGITTTSTIVSRPGKPPVDTTSTVLSDVKSAGLNATIDGSGIHINGNDVPGVAQLQQAINQTFAAAGIKVALSKITRADGASGHSVAAYGLVITYDHTVSNTQPITFTPPEGALCRQILYNTPIFAPGSGLDPCSGVSFTLEGVYHGQVALGQVGVLSFAQPGFNSGGITPPVGPPPGGGPTPGVQSSSGPGPPPPTSPSVTTSNPPTGPGPVVAPGQQNVADQLGGVSHRLEWLFPLFALGVFALIGRLRVPARLPGPK